MREARFIFPNNGYPADQAMARRYLEIGKSYAIEKMDIGDFNTKIWLKELPEKCFNSVLFDIKDVEEEKQYCPYFSSENCTADCDLCNYKPQKQRGYNVCQYLNCKTLTRGAKFCFEHSKEKDKIQYPQTVICSTPMHMCKVLAYKVCELIDEINRLKGL